MKSLFVAVTAAAALVAASSFGYALRARAEGAQPFVQIAQRDWSRLGFFTQTGFAGQVNIDCEAPAWKDDYKGMVGKLPEGKRVRLGKNYWTRLETDLDVTIGGAALKPGQYFICAQKGKGDAWSLIALDANEMRKNHMDGFASEQSTGGIEIPLTSVKSDSTADELTIKFATNKADQTNSLEVEFGPYKLSAPVVAKT